MDRGKKMEIIYDRIKKVGDVQRIPDILRRKEVKKINIKVKCKSCNWRDRRL